MIPQYAVSILLAVALGLLVCSVQGYRARIPLRRFVLFQLVLGFSGLVGAKLFALWEHGWVGVGWAALTGPGLRHPGGILAVLLAFPIARRLLIPSVSLGGVADVLAPGAAVGMACSRLGCWFAQCCFGTVSSVPWAIVYPEGSPAWHLQVLDGLIPDWQAHTLPVHPLFAYFAVLGLVTAAILLRAAPHKRYDGQVMLLFLAIHESGKALLESFRPSAAAGALQVVSAVVALGAMALLFAWWARPPTTIPRRRLLES